MKYGASFSSRKEESAFLVGYPNLIFLFSDCKRSESESSQQ
jgi:hypothetical protein